MEPEEVTPVDRDIAYRNRRIDPLAPPPPLASPTGEPFFPTKWAPYAGALLALAYVGSRLAPGNTVVFEISDAILGLGILLGLASPGWRKKP